MAGYLEHTVGPATRWDHLAYVYYGNADRTGPIIRANLALFADAGGVPTLPTILPVGLVLKIPVLDPEPSAVELPPWKRGAP